MYIDKNSGRAWLVLFIFLFSILPCFGLGKAEGGEFIRSDVNNNGFVEVGDVIATIAYIFGGSSSACLDAMDSNDDGQLNVGDPIYALSALFGSTPPLAPYPWCGEDPTVDSLDCEQNKICDLGGPIEGLTPSQYESYERGRVLMKKRFTPSEGLGPFYNATSCESCHSTPVLGGSSPLYRNFYLLAFGDPGSQVKDPSLPSLVLPSYHTTQGPRPNSPDPLTAPTHVLAHRNSPPLFGTGLFEFVPNSEITMRADPEDLDLDGISGRFNLDTILDSNIGRFGYKCQANFIEAFIRGALTNQMGVTSSPVSGSSGAVSISTLLQVSSSFDDPTIDNDGVADPEISVDELADLILFCRFIAPPKPKVFGADEIAGEVLFQSIGCVKCHTPELNSSVGPLGAYSDLLIHSMGSGLADGLSFGFPQFSSIEEFTTETEFRTQPLWGVSMSAPFLHDGSADTLEEAIIRHGGESLQIRQAYEALSPLEKSQVIKFLEAL